MKNRFRLMTKTKKRCAPETGNAALSFSKLPHGHDVARFGIDNILFEGRRHLGNIIVMHMSRQDRYDGGD